MMGLNEIEKKIVEQYKYLEGNEASWEEIKDKTFVEAGLDSMDNIEGIMWAERKCREKAEEFQKI